MLAFDIRRAGLEVDGQSASMDPEAFGGKEASAGNFGKLRAWDTRFQVSIMSAHHWARPRYATASCQAVVVSACRLPCLTPC